MLEHTQDPSVVLNNIFRSLEPGGRAIFLVPQHEWLFGSLDKALGNQMRYTKSDLEGTLEDVGFAVQHMVDFNRTSVPGWWVNGKVLSRNRLSPVQLKVFDTLTPLIRRFDDRVPWAGQSLIAIAKRP